MRTTITLLILFLTISYSNATNRISTKEKSEINALLNKQVSAWNSGNIDAFMETYLHSDKLVFVGSGGPVYGWNATLERYKKSYPDKAAMGNLSFKISDISKIDKKTIFVIGRFELTRNTNNLAGYFTLVIQKIKNNWVIVSDHTSAEK